MPKVRNVGAYRVTGEKSDNQAETGCTNGERELLVRHDKPEVFYRLEIPSENSSRREGIVVANAAATSLALRHCEWLAAPARSGARHPNREHSKGRAANDLDWCRGGDSSDAGEEVGDGLAGQAAGHKHQPGAAVGIGPVLELDRRMRDMLNIMDDNRPTAFGHREEPFDTQQVRAAQSRQHRHGLFKARPGQGLREYQ